MARRRGRRYAKRAVKKGCFGCLFAILPFLAAVAAVIALAVN